MHGPGTRLLERLGARTLLLATLLAVGAAGRPLDLPLSPAERSTWIEEFLESLEEDLSASQARAATLESRARASHSLEDLVLARVGRARVQLAPEGPDAAEDTLRSARVLSPAPRGLAAAFLHATQHLAEAARGRTVESFETLERALEIAREAGAPGFVLRLELRESLIRNQIQGVPMPGEELARLREEAGERGAPGLVRRPSARPRSVVPPAGRRCRAAGWSWRSSFVACSPCFAPR